MHHTTPSTRAPGSRRARWALLSALALIASLATFPAGATHAEVSLAGSDFEIDVDANLKVDDAGNLDWANVDAVVTADQATGRNDNSFSGGAKEDDPCPGTTTGSIPNNKSDLLNFGVYIEDGDPGYLHLFWTRVQEPSGTTLMDFELNQSSTDCGNGVNPVRTVGDLLLEYRIEQGGAQAVILAREWTGNAWGPEQDLTAIAMATGTINSSPIPAADAAGLGALSARTFGEASIDLDFLFDEGECTSFGSAFLKSRSSTSFTSQLKDFIAPVPVNISNCGSITIEKQTNPDGAAGSFGFTTTGGLDPVTFDLEDDGSRTYSNVLAGTYTVVEDDDAPGELSDITCDSDSATVDLTTRGVSIELAADDHVTCTFTNDLAGSILVHKVDGSGAPLAGAGFTIDPGTPADDSDDIEMTESTDGVFCTDVPFGTYTVTESTVPPGYTGGAPGEVTVDSVETCEERLPDGEPDLEVTNNPSPGTITITKEDDDGTPMAGITFALYQGGVEVDSCTTDASGTCTIDDVPLGDYTLDETDLPDGYAADPDLPVDVTIGLGDEAGVGQTVTLSFTNPQTHRVIVIVCHEGTATLAASEVTDGVTTLTTIGAVPAGIDEAALCGLDGYGDLGHVPLDLAVDVGSEAHAP